MRIKRGCGDEPHPWFFISNKRLFRNSLYQPFRLLASGGPTFGRPKVGRKTAGETPDPHFCPIGRHQGRCTVATEFLRGCQPLVIGAVLCRTSPDSPRTEGCCPVFLWQNPIQLVILNQKYTDIIQDSCCQSCTAADPSGSAPGSCPPGSPELPPWSAPG